MKFERIEAIPLRMPLDKVFQGAGFAITERATILTRVHVEGGLVGECFNGNDDSYQAEILRIIEDEMAPRVTGLPVMAVERSWDAMRAPSRNFLRHRSLVRKAQACVDSAIWDAVGKICGQPLHRLWGGYSDKVRVLCLGGYYQTDNDIAAVEAEAAGMADSGIAGVKLKVGGRSPDVDAERVAAARRGGGADFEIMVDANCGWSVDDAARFANLIADHNVRWFEEPCQWTNDRRDMVRLRGRMSLPICAGQSEITREGAAALMEAGAIDWCNYDASWGGGPTEWLRVARTAQSFGVSALQHLEPQIGAALGAALSNGGYMEVMSPERDPFFYRLIANTPEFENGLLTLPDAPGWGWTFDETLIEKFRV